MVFYSSDKYQTIVIGGGAAGLIAAISAARSKYKVLVIERNESVGRKILITGNERCNLTNTNTAPNKYFGENTKCLHNIFNRFSYNDTIKFFEELGVHLKTEKDGRVYPITDNAATILDTLVNETKRLKIKINLNERVLNLTPIESGWKTITNKNSYWSKSVILATGGRSYPQLGSTGDGFDIAQKLGHRIIEPRPALVPLELEGNWFKELQGVKVNVQITLKVQGKTITRQTGEMLFTHFGISGPVVLDLSRLIIEYLCKPDSIVSVNFLPGYNSNELSQYLNSVWLNQPRKTLVNSLTSLLPKKLVSVLLYEMKIEDTKKVNQLTKKDKQLLTERLSNCQLEVKSPRSFDESMVTAGGVSMNEINIRTMESLKAKGLYLAGEVLDIDGKSGGYNLQFAWSTGYLAGLQQ